MLKFNAVTSDVIPITRYTLHVAKYKFKTLGSVRTAPLTA